MQVLQNCLHIVLLQETETSDNVTENVTPKTNETSSKPAFISKDDDVINPTEVNNPHFESLSADPIHDEENNDVDYPAKTLLRLLST